MEKVTSNLQKFTPCWLYKEFKRYQKKRKYPDAFVQQLKVLWPFFKNSSNDKRRADKRNFAHVLNVLQQSSVDLDGFDFSDPEETQRVCGPKKVVNNIE